MNFTPTTLNNPNPNFPHFVLFSQSMAWELTHELHQPGRPLLWSLCFTPPEGHGHRRHEQQLVCCNKNDLVVYANCCGELAAATVLAGHSGGTRCCNCSPDGRWLASVDNYGELRLWDIRANWRPVHALPQAHTNIAACCAFSAQGLLATASFDGSVAVWDPADAALLARMAFPAKVYSCAWSSTSPRLLAAGGPGLLVLLDAPSGQSVRRLPVPADVMCCAFAPQDRWLAAGGSDHRVRLFDPRSGEPVHLLEGHSRILRGCTWSADASLLASTGDDGTVCLWQPAAGTLLLTLAHAASVNQCAFNSTDTTLACCCDNGTIAFWSRRGLTQILVLVLAGRRHATRRLPPELWLHLIEQSFL